MWPIEAFPHSQSLEDLEWAAARPEMATAIELSAPSLARAISGGFPDDRKRQQRAARTVEKYLVRSTTRATPYGALAGVALGSFEGETELTLDPSRARAYARPDMGWLLRLIRQIEQDEAIAPQISVRWSGAAYVREHTVYLGQSLSNGRARGGAVELSETPAIRKIRELASGTHPITLSQLAADLLLAFPDGDIEASTALLQDLLSLGVLESSLTPSAAEVDPLSKLVSQLLKLPGANSYSGSLSELRGCLEAVDLLDASSVRKVREIAAGILPDYDGESIQVDTEVVLDKNRLSSRVGSAAADCVSFLARLSERSEPFSRDIVDFSNRFRDRYGAGMVVPLLEALDPKYGIDAPRGYMNPPPEQVWPNEDPSRSVKYDRFLESVLLHPRRQFDEPITITEEWENSLLGALADDQAANRDASDPFPAFVRSPHDFVDVFMQIDAASPKAIDDGDFTLILNDPGISPGDNAIARFGYALSLDSERDLLQRKVGQRLGEGCLLAELTYMPRLARTLNVSLRTLGDRVRIRCQDGYEGASEDCLEVTDLGLFHSGDGLKIWSFSRQQEVCVVERHMLNRTGAPNAARLLLDLSDSWRHPLQGFSWGRFEGASHLPRVQRGKVVLRLAEWNMSLADMAARKRSRAAEGNDPVRDLREWLSEWGVPRYVYFTELDNRLLCDTSRTSSLEELSRLLEKTGSLRLVEGVPGVAQGWVIDIEGQRYAGELVIRTVLAQGGEGVQYVSNAPGDEGSDVQPTGGSLRTFQPIGHMHRALTRASRSKGRPRVFPLTQWDTLKLYSPFDSHDRILLDQIRPLIDSLRRMGLIDRWFFLRYGDPQAHLRLRLRKTAGMGLIRKGELSVALEEFINDLVALDIVSDVQISGYEPEVSRYGGPDVFPLIEEYFEADSDAALLLLGALKKGDLEDVDSHVTGALSVDAVVAPLLNAVEVWDPIGFIQQRSSMARNTYKSNRDVLVQSMESWPGPREAQAERIRQVLAPSVAVRREVSESLLATLIRAREEGRLWGDPLNILVSLVHMHLNRHLPVDLEREDRIYEILALAYGHVRGREHFQTRLGS